MARLPVIGSDADNWGALLNEFLRVSHHEDGSLRGICGGVSVRDFGAKGDGLNDDTAAIQAALDVLAPRGGILCFPSGTYHVTDTLRCGSSVICQGAGENSTIIKSSLTKAVFQSKAPSFRHHHIHLRDLQIDNTTRANVGSIGIDFSNVSSGVIQNVVIANVETGILLNDSAYYNKLSSVVISTAITGIKMMNGANENHIFSGRIENVTMGIKLDNISNPQVYGISLEGFTTGIEIGPTAVASPKIFGCRFENLARSGTGISIASTTLAAIIIGPYFQNVTTNISDSATDSNILADVHWKIGGGTAVRRHQRITAAIDFPAIAAQSTNDQLVAISGLTNVDSVFVTPDPNIPAGLLVMGIPASSNGVYIRMANITTAVIDPLPLTFTIDIWQHE